MPVASALGKELVALHLNSMGSGLAFCLRKVKRQDMTLGFEMTPCFVLIVFNVSLMHKHENMAFTCCSLLVHTTA